MPLVIEQVSGIGTSVSNAEKPSGHPRRQARPRSNRYPGRRLDIGRQRRNPEQPAERCRQRIDYQHLPRTRQLPRPIN
jgi:hypothetical protein